MKRSTSLLAVLLACVALSQSALAQEPNAMSPAVKLNWQPWSDGVFSQAKREQRFVLLDREAVWCGWRHIVDVTTYRPPVHLAVVGPKDDSAARGLFEAALPNPDVQYPSVPRAAAYVCTERTCSAPIFKPEDVSAKVNRVLGLQESKAALSFLPPAPGTSGE